MAKDREKQVAKKYFVEFYKTQKEIAEDLGVTEKTVGKWVNDGNWKVERDARINSKQNQAMNLKSLISELTDKALDILEKIKIIEAKGIHATSEEKDLLIEHKKESSRISQEVAMYNKTLTQFQSDKLPLGLYIEVMEDIFKELQLFDKNIYMKTLDFQRSHLQTTAQKLG